MRRQCRGAWRKARSTSTLRSSCCRARPIDLRRSRRARSAARCWRGQFNEGLADLEEAAVEAARGGFRLREVQARMEQGYHLVAAGREAEGLSLLRPAFLQAEELGDLRRPADMHERLSALYEARGDYQRALAHHKRFVEVK